MLRCHVTFFQTSVFQDNFQLNGKFGIDNNAYNGKGETVPNGDKVAMDTSNGGMTNGFTDIEKAKSSDISARNTPYKPGIKSYM